MFKDMKKLEYVAPELEEIKLVHNAALLEASDQQAPGTGDYEDL
jgi:hypothetical protein